ncbi:MAG: translocation/assembly module TamB domain-containing protein [Acidobacteriia bacterium]|nr:translocation/assembly module TamB domain-containing protein [Terriglobia bacterium]
MSRKRIVLTIAGSVAGLLLLTLMAGILVVRSQWFYDQVRQRVVSTVETATGGRVEARSFQFDWKQLKAEVKDFAIHGTEPADKPALFRASSVAVGLKIVSLLKRDVDIQYLDVADPRIYLIVYPDGHTNVPEPKIRPNNPRSPVETILNLAIGSFNIRNGVFAVEARGETPFDARGQKLDARFLYELPTPGTAPRYRADISIHPLDVHWPGYPVPPLGVTVALTLEKNRIDLTSMKLTSGESRIDFSGAIEDLASPHGAFQYDARVSVAEAAPILHLEELKGGTVEVGGNATWKGSSDLSATGNLHAYSVEFRDSLLRLADSRVDGALTANLKGIDLSGIRLSTTFSGTGPCARPSGTDDRLPSSVSRTATLWPCPTAHLTVEGRIANATQRGKDLEFHNVALAFLGGGFQGEIRLRDLVRYNVNGEIAGIDARRVMAFFSAEPLPWDATASGPVSLDGALGRKTELRVAANLTVGPAAEGAPVHGQITAAYEARNDLLDLGRSTLSLPSSRADFSGAVPPVAGRELRVHFETRDLNDVLPVFGQSAAAVPVKLENGTVIFDGMVTGKLDSPQIAGHLGVTRFSYAGQAFDSLEGGVSASPGNVELQNATLVRGAVRAQFQAAVGLRQWKADDNSPISGNGTMRNANLADVAPVGAVFPTGTISGNAQVAGTVGSPTVSADIDVAKGTFQEEPFDRFTGHVSYSGRRVEVASGQIAAGAKQVQVTATFDHAPDRFDAGRLRFQVATNAMPLDQIRRLEKERPGVKGTVQLSASGEVDITPPAKGQTGFRIADLHADISGKGLQLSGQSFGDAHLTATSQDQVLNAHLESDFANSAVQGDGQWRLEGDYPGSATIRFSKLDFAQLRAWISPSESAAADRVAGSAEGELRIDGPALKPATMKAELRIPKLEIGPAPGTVPPAGAITLTNSGPIVASLANSVVTVESAHLVGRSTDLNVTGKVLLDQKNPLDLRVNGHVDLALVHDFDPDLVSSGTITADATVRGAIAAPQLNGRVQFQNAAFSLADFPNGISNANGVILLTAERATIQSFSGETGGGKIELSGSAGYSGGATIFQLQAHAQQVRVRYPEGVSTVASASLNLTGTPDRSMLDGTVTILRTGFNLQSDFSSVIAKSAEPVRTPAAHGGLLGGLNFDIQINTDPDIQLQSALTEDLQAEASLRLRGTVSNPAMVGRILITQGQVVFYGTKYNISQGTIAFYNALKVEPILDVDLETKAHGIDITLTVAGPLNKLHLTPRSDPPLQFSEIVALLATGRTPTSDPTLLVQQSTAPQSWQQMGATALLGQAIANPVAGRLQRFFGVSKLRIDPTLPGVENNPQARLTLEQQVTPDITFTYITNVTNSNPQVVRMEWSFSKQWSVVALRDENGTFGLDFFFKKRF